MVREGMNKSNLELLTPMIQTVESTCSEGMVCGDYNMTVPTVLGSGLVLQARMQIARAGAPTYVSSKSAVEIDFAMITNGLAKVLDEVKIDGKIQCPPHRVVQLDVRERAKQQAHFELEVPPRLPLVKMVGPLVHDTELEANWVAIEAGVQHIESQCMCLDIRSLQTQVDYTWRRYM